MRTLLKEEENTTNTADYLPENWGFGSLEGNSINAETASILQNKAPENEAVETEPPKHGEARTQEGCTDYWDEYADSGGVDKGAWVSEKPKSFGSAQAGSFEQYVTGNYDAGSPDDCITSFNKGQKILHEDDKLKLGSQIISGGNVKGSGNILQEKGLAEKPFFINYTVVPDPNDAESGQVQPVENIEETILAHTPSHPGKYFFAVGLGYGYHTITVIVDKTDLENIQVYTADQVVGYQNRTNREDENIDTIEAMFNRYTQSAHESYCYKNNKKTNVMHYNIKAELWLVVPK